MYGFWSYLCLYLYSILCCLCSNAGFVQSSFVFFVVLNFLFRKTFQNRGFDLYLSYFKPYQLVFDLEAKFALSVPSIKAPDQVVFSYPFPAFLNHYFSHM